MEKFLGGDVRSIAATVGAVVSNPTETKTTSLSVFFAISTALCAQAKVIAGLHRRRRSGQRRTGS